MPISSDINKDNDSDATTESEDLYGEIGPAMEGGARDEPTQGNMFLREVYWDWVHTNYFGRLSGGIAEDAF